MKELFTVAKILKLFETLSPENREYILFRLTKIDQKCVEVVDKFAVIKEQMRQDRDIFRAIRSIRELTGKGLKDSKDIVEAWGLR